MKALKSNKGIIVLVVFIIAAYFLMNYMQQSGRPIIPNAYDIKTYRDDFSRLDEDFWYVGEWLTHRLVPDAVTIEQGVASLFVKQTDKGPYMLSRAIAVANYDVIKVKRRVKVHYGSEYFAGGLTVFENETDIFEPDIEAALPFGRPIVLVEYAHDHAVDTKRPGQDNIRVLTPTWQSESNYAVLPPIYDEYFTEELTINSKSGQIIYTVDDRVVQLSTAGVSRPYIRILMHSYGAFSGHDVSVDDIEITLTYSENEAFNHDAS